MLPKHCAREKTTRGVVNITSAIFTLYEGNYHHGVAALINSAIASGFDGRFLVGYRDKLPPWADSLKRLDDLEYEIEGRKLTFFRDVSNRHFGYHKPMAALSILERFPDIKTLVYADPDITLLAPWEFFRDWAAEGVGLVGDVNFSVVPPEHPWRRKWSGLLKEAGQTVQNACEKRYPNAGFLIINRSEQSLLETWRDVTLAYEQQGGNTKSFQMSDRWKAVVGDQDLLAAAIMGWSGRVSVLGPEVMGFTGYFFILSHAIETPKPWAKSYLLCALRGCKPTKSGRHYLQFASFPVKGHGRIRAAVKKADFLIALLFSRFFHR